MGLGDGIVDTFKTCKALFFCESHIPNGMDYSGRSDANVTEAIVVSPQLMSTYKRNGKTRRVVGNKLGHTNQELREPSGNSGKQETKLNISHLQRPKEIARPKPPQISKSNDLGIVTKLYNPEPKYNLRKSGKNNLDFPKRDSYPVLDKDTRNNTNTAQVSSTNYFYYGLAEADGYRTVPQPTPQNLVYASAEHLLQTPMNNNAKREFRNDIEYSFPKTEGNRTVSRQVLQTNPKEISGKNSGKHFLPSTRDLRPAPYQKPPHINAGEDNTISQKQVYSNTTSGKSTAEYRLSKTRTNDTVLHRTPQVINDSEKHSLPQPQTYSYTEHFSQETSNNTAEYRPSKTRTNDTVLHRTPQVIKDSEKHSLPQSQTYSYTEHFSPKTSKNTAEYRPSKTRTNDTVLHRTLQKQVHTDKKHTEACSNEIFSYPSLQEPIHGYASSLDWTYDDDRYSQYKLDSFDQNLWEYKEHLESNLNNSSERRTLKLSKNTISDLSKSNSGHYPLRELYPELYSTSQHHPQTLDILERNKESPTHRELQESDINDQKHASSLGRNSNHLHSLPSQIVIRDTDETHSNKQARDHEVLGRNLSGKKTNGNQNMIIYQNMMKRFEQIKIDDAIEQKMNHLIKIVNSNFMVEQDLTTYEKNYLKKIYDVLKKCKEFEGRIDSLIVGQVNEARVNSLDENLVRNIEKLDRIDPEDSEILADHRKNIIKYIYKLIEKLEAKADLQ